MTRTKINTEKYVKSPTEINGVRVVNNAGDAFEALMNGETVARFEYGDSMMPILRSGEYCILHPVTDTNQVNIGDAVFCKVEGYLMTHMVINKTTSHVDKPYFLIGDTNMNIYGWTSDIYAIAKGTNIVEEPIEFDASIWEN